MRERYESLRRRAVWLAPLSVMLLAPAAFTEPLQGFEASPHFNEQTLTERFDDCVTVHINAVGTAAFFSAAVYERWIQPD